MARILSVMIMVFGFQYAHAQSNSQAKSIDFGRSDSKGDVLSAKELRSRFELIGKIYVADAKGRLLYQGSEERKWKFGSSGDLVSNWSYQDPSVKEIALRHTWTISDEGRIEAHIQQFESMKKNEKSSAVETGKLIREEKIELKDFVPIHWVVHSDAQKRVVVRLLPELAEKTEFLKIDALPVTLNNPLVFDNKGRLWAQGESLEGLYIAMKTHLGQFAVSYLPFKGAKEIGYIAGSEMTLHADNGLKIMVRSDRPILTTSRPAKIYGKVNLAHKSDGLNSVRATASGTEKSFLEIIK